MPKITETPMPPAIELPTPSSIPDDVPNRPLTADEAVQIALRRQPTIKAAEAGLRAAEGRTQTARAGLMPSLTVGAAHTNVDSNGDSAGSGGSSASGSGSDGYQLTGTARQLLFDFNHTRDAVREASAQQRSASAGLTRAQSDLAFAVKQAFYGHAQNARLVEVYEANVKNRQGHLDLAQARLNSGLGLPSDVVRAETARAEAIFSLNLVRANASVSRVLLAQLMGIDPRTPIAVADSQEQRLPTEDADALVAQALEQRPEVRQAEAIREAAGYGLSAAKTGNAPSLGATAGWNGRGSTPSFDSRSLSLGLAITWSAFDSGLTAGRVKEAAADVQSADAQVESVRLSVIADVSQAYLDLKTAEQRVITADAEVANATEAVRLTEGRYRGEIGAFMDVLDAQTALLVAETNRVNSLSTVNLARSALVHAVGGPMNAK
jgi:outer membrane protein TolC